MADQDHQQNSNQESAGRRVSQGRVSENDYLELELDAALAKYAAIEPRPGLEDRVLANLRSVRGHAAPKVWWRWPAVGLAAAALVVTAVFLMGRLSMSRPGNPTPEVAAHQPAATSQGDKQPGARIASNDAGSPAHPAVPQGATRPPRHSVHSPHAIAANSPRLDHFPSPRPLSNEEKLLVRYVRDFPRDAVMIAQAQEESEKEMDQMNGNAPSGANQGQQQDPQ